MGPVEKIEAIKRDRAVLDRLRQCLLDGVDPGWELQRDVLESFRLNQTELVEDIRETFEDLKEREKI